jgi:hypothetical protein
VTPQQRTEARLALQSLLDKANAARIKHAAAYHVTGDPGDKAIATAAEEVVAVLEKHLSQLSENE